MYVKIGSVVGAIFSKGLCDYF